MAGGRRSRVVFAAWAGAFGVLFVVARPVPAVASQIVQPSPSPVVVPVAPTGSPAAITVVAVGFTAGSLVYVEQCDGVATTTAQWSPTVHCDLGSSPSAAIADSRGLATFSSTDRNRAFRPFAGESPQSLFNCLAPSQAAPTNGLPNFTNCTLRVSTSNTAVTTDQTFIPVVLTTSHAVVPTTMTTKRTTTTVGATRSRTAKKARASSTSSGQRSKGNGSSGRRTSASSSVAAAVSAPQHANVGLLSFSDPNLTTGYILVLGGLLLAGLAIALRRRRPASRRPVTGTQIASER
jgi:hypothetical protein